MIVTILGSGTSNGVPVIGCTCPVCLSSEKKNNRTRSSIWIQGESASVVIDTATEFRIQALREGIDWVDAVFLTHAHADHIHGLDDIRPLSYNKTIPVYGNEPTIAEIQHRFDYIFKGTQKGGGKPRITLHTLGAGTVRIEDLTITPVPVLHGKLPILAYRIGDVGYCTDCSYIPESSIKLLANLKLLIIGSLRYTPHPTHFSVSQTVEVFRELRPKKAYLTHISHEIEHNTLASELPDGIEPAWDGLNIEI